MRISCRSSLLLLSLVFLWGTLFVGRAQALEQYQEIRHSMLQHAFVNRREIKVIQPAESFTKWAAALERHERQFEADVTRLSAAMLYARVRWNVFITRTMRLHPKDQISEVHRFFNSISYAPDSEVWNRNDFWATPLEMLAAGRGDCEDIAIAKYLALRALGFADDDRRLVILKEKASDGRAHATMLVKFGGESFVLDNLYPAARPMTALSRYLPVYSLSEKSAWVYFPSL